MTPARDSVPRSSVDHDYMAKGAGPAKWTSRLPKYRAQRTAGIGPDGAPRVYDSAKEARYSLWLHARQSLGEIASWEPQARITLCVDGDPLVPYMGKRATVYVADFLVCLPNGSVEVHEVKGYQSDKDPVTRLWRLKLGVVQAMHPDWKIVLA